MTRRAAAGYVGLAAVGLVVVWLLFVALPRWYAPRPTEASATPAAASAAAIRKIKARLFYVSDEGGRLMPLEQEVPFGEGTAEQAKHILAAQLEPPAAPLVSAIPAGTRLRTLYVTEKGEAYVDLSREVSAAHPGGSLNEILTVYTIVDALAANLPAITSVQILIDGKEAETLAGHVDLRRPLQRDLRWVAGGEGK